MNKRLMMARIAGALAIAVTGVALQASAAQAGAPISSVEEIFDLGPGIGGGVCIATSDVYYDADMDGVQVDAAARVTAKGRGCKVQTWVTVETTAGKYSWLTTIPTVCATGDLSCPRNPKEGQAGRGHSYESEFYPIDGKLVSVTSHYIEAR